MHLKVLLMDLQLLQGICFKGGVQIPFNSSSWTTVKGAAVLILALVQFSPVYAQISVTDDDIGPGSTVIWTADHVYQLEDIVFVDSAATLIIEPGTVIKADPG